MASRVFCGAQTPARPPELNSWICWIWPAGAPGTPVSRSFALFSNANLPVKLNSSWLAAALCVSVSPMKPSLNGLPAPFLLLAHPVEQGLADEAPPAMLRPLVVRRQRVVPLLEARELVGRRQVGVGLRCALDLGDLVQRLVVGAGLVVGGIDRLAVALHQVEHEPVAGIGVVRNGEQRRTLGALIVHPLPQDLGIVGIEGGQHQVGQVLGVAEDDDAVQVALLRIRRPFEAGEGSELAGDVVGVRRLDDLGPDGTRQRRIAQLRVALAIAHVAQDAGKGLYPHVGVRRGHALGNLRLADRVVGVRHLVEDPHVLGMVGHHVEVERGLELHVRPAAAGDRPALRPGVGIRRCRLGAIGQRVERPAGVDVDVAEVGAVLGVRRRQGGGRCGRRRRSGRGRCRWRGRAGRQHECETEREGCSSRLHSCVSPRFRQKGLERRRGSGWSGCPILPDLRHRGTLLVLLIQT